MVAIADVLPRPKSRFLFDRPELIGPLFIAPAIAYVLVLVALNGFFAAAEFSQAARKAPRDSSAPQFEALPLARSRQ